MRRFLSALALALAVAGCAHAAKPTEMVVASPAGSAPLVNALGADVKTEGVMGVAWSHGTAYKPWAAAAESIFVLSERAGDIDVIDARSGHKRTLPLGETVGNLIGTAGPMVLGTTSNKVVALDPSGGILWSRGVTHASSASQAAPIGGSVVVFMPQNELGHPAARLIALARADGAVVWTATLPLDANASLVRFGTSAMLWHPAGNRVTWDVLDEMDGHVALHGDEPGSRIVTRGRKFYVCDEEGGVVRVHSGSGDPRTVPFSGRCSEMAVDDDSVYSIRSHLPDGSGEVSAVAIADGAQRWSRSFPVGRGALAFGAWVLLPSDGGVIRALRKDTGEPSWSYGVGARVNLVPFDDRIVLAVGDSTLHGLETMTALPAEKTSTVTLHVRSWGCVDRASTSLYVGDVLAAADGQDRFTAMVHGRGRVLVRPNPWADVILYDGEREREWSYAPVGVDIDGQRHALEIELDNCDED